MLGSVTVSFGPAVASIVGIILNALLRVKTEFGVD